MNSGRGGYNSGPGQWPSPHVSGPDANMMMQQIAQLQQTVRELQSGGGPGTQGGSSGTAGFGGYGAAAMGPPGEGPYVPGTQGMSNYRSGLSGTWSSGNGGGPKRERKSQDGNEDSDINPETQTVLLVSNIPPNLANPDSLFYAFEKFGTVMKVKILHNKRNTALIQMNEPAEAQRAIEEQDKLNRLGTDIYVNYSSKFTDIRMPEPGSMYDDGLAKDFTGKFVSMAPQRPGGQFGMGEGGMGRGMMGGGGGFGFGNGNGGRGNFGPMGGDGFGDDFAYGMRGGRTDGVMGAGVVLLVSNIPEEIANVDHIFNMVGMYGDVMFVKILRNKRDCCMVQMAKPHHAQQVKQCLDHAKVGGNKLCVSYSRVDNLLNKRIPDDDELQKDFLNSRNHRYRSHTVAAKLSKNLGPPTSTLHVANLPEGFTHSDIKDLFIEKGFTVKDSQECGNGGMAFLSMPSPDEALMALAIMHNYAPQELKFKNASGLCVSFSK